MAYVKLLAESVGAEMSPVPLSAIVCGEPVASSVMVIEAANGPSTAGTKRALIEQWAPAATLVPQVLEVRKSEALAPVIAMLEIAIGAVLVLVNVTDCRLLVAPTAKSPNDMLVADSVGAGTYPVPLSAIVCGELLASSTTVTVAANAPVDAGVKIALIVQFPPTATLEPHVLVTAKEDAPAPETVMLVKAKGAVPVLVRVTDWDALAVPSIWLANVRLVAESVGELTKPVPESAIVCGEPVASSVMVIEAVSGPSAVGTKRARIEQLAPAARDVPQVFEVRKEEAFAPVIVMLEMAIGAVLVFVNVTDCRLLVAPTARSPKDRLVADSVGAGTYPVPLSAMVCGELLASSTMVTVAANAPVDTGVKIPLIVQFPPTATLEPQVLVTAKEDAPAPETVMLAIARGAVPVLVSVTDWDALAVSSI